MSVRNRMVELVAVDEVDAFLEQYPTSVIFKAGSCHKTMQGFGHVEEALNPRENIHVAFVRVVQSRPVSNYIADITGIKHESPQVILFVDGKPVYDVDNWDITPEELTANLNHYLGQVDKESGLAAHRGDVAPYVELLQDFVDGALSESEFSQRWVYTFKADATPRSKDEFNLLNSLYDKGICSADRTDTQPFREKAKQLLETLTSY